MSCDGKCGCAGCATSLKKAESTMHPVLCPDCRHVVNAATPTG